MERQLLIEQLTPTQSSIVTEAVQHGDNLFLNGIFMQADVKNQNGRNYPLHELTRVVESANTRIQEHNGIIGELDHPQSLTVNLDRSSHIITELSMQGSNAVGRAKILEKTPMGAIAKALIEAGVKIGVSSRGTGNVGTDGNVSNFELLTVDIVANPSATGAVPNAVYESLGFANGPEVVTLAEQLQHDNTAQKYFQREMMKFITNVFNG